MNIFECMEIVENIYKVLVTPSYKKTTRSEANRNELISNKRVEYAS